MSTATILNASQYVNYVYIGRLSKEIETVIVPSVRRLKVSTTAATRIKIRSSRLSEWDKSVLIIYRTLVKLRKFEMKSVKIASVSN